MTEYGIEQLCNAVIVQAAKDYRENMAFLKKHPKPPELVEKVSREKAEREKKITEWVRAEKNRLADRAERRWGADFDRKTFTRSLDVSPPKRLFPPSKDELYLDKIMAHEYKVRELEDFFRSKWYSEMTELDGEMLLRKLREEFADESD